MSIRRKLRRGFTLVELMIVVAIVGVLAVLAVYGVSKYLANAKTTEARNALGRMGKDAVAAYESERMAPGVLTPGSATGIIRQMCGNSTAPVPATPDLIKGMKYQSTRLDWANATDVTNNAGFPCLKFEMTAPQYYMYNYQITGAGTAPGDTFVATANGDLNGDDVLSTFTLTGQISTAAEGNRLLVAPAIQEQSPQE